MTDDDRQPIEVYVHVEPEDLVPIATQVGEEHRARGPLTTDDVEQIVDEHYDVKHVFSVAGSEVPVAEYLAEHTHIDLEDQQGEHRDAVRRPENGEEADA
ncbi:hypothetical protein ACYJ1Y_16175 [Natrialbaceae archaeon A-gly3]